jgi:CheY-like chemotaxis protein
LSSSTTLPGVLLVCDPEEAAALGEPLRPPMSTGPVRTWVASEPDDAVALFSSYHPEVMVVAASLRAGDVAQLIERVRAQVGRAEVAVVVIGTLEGPMSTALDAAELGGDRFLSRPLSPKALRYAVAVSIDAARLARGGRPPGVVQDDLLDDPTGSYRQAQRARWARLADSIIDGVRGDEPADEGGQGGERSSGPSAGHVAAELAAQPSAPFVIQPRRHSAPLPTLGDADAAEARDVAARTAAAAKDASGPVSAGADSLWPDAEQEVDGGRSAKARRAIERKALSSLASASALAQLASLSSLPAGRDAPSEQEPAATPEPPSSSSSSSRSAGWAPTHAEAAMAPGDEVTPVRRGDRAMARRSEASVEASVEGRVEGRVEASAGPNDRDGGMRADAASRDSSRFFGVAGSPSSPIPRDESSPVGLVRPRGALAARDSSRFLSAHPSIPSGEATPVGVTHARAARDSSRSLDLSDDLPDDLPDVFGAALPSPPPSPPPSPSSSIAAPLASLTLEPDDAVWSAPELLAQLHEAVVAEPVDVAPPPILAVSVHPPGGREFARQLRQKMSAMAQRLFAHPGSAGALEAALDSAPRHDHQIEFDLAALVEEPALVDIPEISPLRTHVTPIFRETQPGTWDSGGKESRDRIPDSGDLIRGLCDAPAIVVRMWTLSATGRVFFCRGETEKIVFFDQGRLVFASSTELHDRMGELLYREGKITHAQYMHSKSLVAESGRRMGEVLVELGYLKRRELYPAVRRHVEDIIYSLFAWDHGTYRISVEERATTERIRLARHPEALVLEGIRRKLDRNALERLVGPPSTVLELHDRERLAGLAAAIELSPEERAALAAIDGQADLPAVARASGLAVAAVLPLAWALIVLGYVTARREVAEVADETSHVGESDLAIDRERVRARWQLVAEADYFALLGVRRDATSFEIRRAYEAARRDFAAEGFPGELRHELARELDDIATVLDEAFRVLRDDSLRREYLAHLVD